MNKSDLVKQILGIAGASGAERQKARAQMQQMSVAELQMAKRLAVQEYGGRQQLQRRQQRAKVPQSVVRQKQQKKQQRRPQAKQQAGGGGRLGYREFLSRMGGRGLSRAQLSRAWKQYSAGTINLQEAKSKYAPKQQAKQQAKPKPRQAPKQQKKQATKQQKPGTTWPKFLKRASSAGYTRKQASAAWKQYKAGKGTIAQVLPPKAGAQQRAAATKKAKAQSPRTVYQQIKGQKKYPYYLARGYTVGGGPGGSGIVRKIRGYAGKPFSQLSKAQQAEVVRFLNTVKGQQLRSKGAPKLAAQKLIRAA